MTGESLLIFTISVILVWIKPGPGQAYKITTTLNSGFLSGYVVALGIITGCIIFFLVAAIGSQIITSFFTNISDSLKVIGMTYLFYLGIKTILNKEKNYFNKTQISNKKLFENYISGLFLNLANPLSILFFLGILPALVPIGNLTTIDILVGIIIIIMVGLVVDGLILMLITQVKIALSDSKTLSTMSIIAGLGFILIGLMLGYSLFFEEKFHFDLI